jgi:Family of unknown function (DUF6600)
MRTTAIAAALGAVLLLTTPLAAQGLADPPARVGRLSYIEGTVSLHAAGEDQWLRAMVNYPVTTGEGFWTEPQSRAEIQIGAVELRLDQATEADILRLDDAATQLRVDQGTVNLHVIAMPPGGILVLTPLGEVDLLAAGSYHVDAGEPGLGGAPANQATVTVLQGRARVAGPRATLTVDAGESAIVTGNPPGFRLVEAEPTPFDDWALERERRELQPTASAWFVPPTMTGHEDLDRYGRWVADPVYGEVWYPMAVPVGWAPYRYGHWVWIPPWGWTWIDDAPWGFAPFHYGRWAFIRDRWAWCPGAYVARPVYAPALVAFIGGGSFGIAISVGKPVGWVPLAPGERFHPWYHTGPTYVRQVNYVRYGTHVTNNVVINNRYSSAQAGQFRNARAVTVVPAHAFAGAAPVQHAALHVDPQHLDRARTMTSLTHVRPTREARGAAAHPEAVNATARPEAHTPNRPSSATTVNRGPVPSARPASVPPMHAAPPPATVMRPPEHASAAPEARPPAPALHPPATAVAPRPPTPTAIVHPPTPTRQAQVRPPPIPHPFTAPPRRVPAHPLPPASVQRPVQTTHITPTPKGWQRAPVQPAAAHPAPAHPAHAHPPASVQHPAPPSGGGGDRDRHP